LDDPLIYVRAIHFAATITVAGVVFFIVFIAEPTFRGAADGARLPHIVRHLLVWIAWTSLVVTVVSGIAWLVLVAQSITYSSLGETLTTDVLGAVLLQTGFGNDWLARFGLACLLGGMFVPFLSRRGVEPLWVKCAVVASAAALTGTLVWAGHAAGGRGLEAVLHPVADFVHLSAAAAWVGTLLPLALVLGAAGHDGASVAFARTATVRFSAFGIVSVATLLITGSINTWYLAGSIPALTETDYGHLLLIKIGLFLVMVAIAAINRLVLTPRLVQTASAAQARRVLFELRINTLLEVAIGVSIIVIVAMLGTNPPGLEAITHAHPHPH
jgi:putative copper resistance protein D